jgi:hypothetical protein
LAVLTLDFLLRLFIFQPNQIMRIQFYNEQLSVAYKKTLEKQGPILYHSSNPKTAERIRLKICRRATP